MIEVFFPTEKIEEILKELKTKKLRGVFYVPRKVFYHGKAGLLFSVLSLFAGNKRKELLEKLKEEISPVEGDVKEEERVYPAILCLPIGFVDEDFEIAQRGARELFSKTSRLLKERGINPEKLTIEELLPALCELVKEGELTYNEFFWVLVIYHALAGWSSLKKWNEREFNGKETSNGEVQDD